MLAGRTSSVSPAQTLRTGMVTHSVPGLVTGLDLTVTSEPSGPMAVTSAWLVSSPPLTESSTVTLKDTVTSALASSAPSVQVMTPVASSYVPPSLMESATSVVPVGTLSVMVTESALAPVLLVYFTS